MDYGQLGYNLLVFGYFTDADDVASAPGLLGNGGPKTYTPGKPGELKRALAEFKGFHGLPPEMSPEDVLRFMQRPRCSMPDRLSSPLGVSGLSSWRQGYRVRVRPIPSLAGWTTDQIVATVKAALLSWTAVCGISFEITTDSGANIVQGVGRIDGPYGMLAWSNLPSPNAGDETQLEQRYDSNENWSGGAHFLQAVVAHECGHAIGLDHAPGSKSLMSPYISDLYLPQSWDIDQAVQRYGPPKPITPPAPPPTPGPNPGPNPGDRIDLFKLRADDGSTIVISKLVQPASGTPI